MSDSVISRIDHDDGPDDADDDKPDGHAVCRLRSVVEHDRTQDVQEERHACGNTAPGADVGVFRAKENAGQNNDDDRQDDRGGGDQGVHVLLLKDGTIY